jgi:5-hydroxyisourate hydrolase
MSGISSHVLDTARGRPAAGLTLHLAVDDGDGGWRHLSTAATDADGRVAALLPAGTALAAATYRLIFETGDWFRGQGIDAFYPQAAVVFRVGDPADHFHVPLLLSPFGYSTYRGS